MRMDDKKHFSYVDYSQIPEHMRRGMSDYLEYGILPGGFLHAVLTNDFHFAVKRADLINRKNFLEWVDFCLSEIPSDSWGSLEKVNAWMKLRRAALDKPLANSGRQIPDTSQDVESKGWNWR